MEIYLIFQAQPLVFPQKKLSLLHVFRADLYNLQVCLISANGPYLKRFAELKNLDVVYGFTRKLRFDDNFSRQYRTIINFGSQLFLALFSPACFLKARRRLQGYCSQRCIPNVALPQETFAEMSRRVFFGTLKPLDVIDRRYFPIARFSRSFLWNFLFWIDDAAQNRHPRCSWTSLQRSCLRTCWRHPQGRCWKYFPSRSVFAGPLLRMRAEHPAAVYCRSRNFYSSLQSRSLWGIIF